MGVGFTVTDSVTGKAVVGAQCSIWSLINFAGEGVGGLSNEAGYVYLGIPGKSSNSWRVSKTGYVAQAGNGPPLSLNVALVPTTPAYNLLFNVSGRGAITATLGGAPVDVSPGTVTRALEGSKLVVTASPEPDTYLAKWMLYGSIQTPTNPLAVTVSRDLTLYAVFEDRIRVTFIAGSGGTVKPTGTFLYDKGQGVSCAATPGPLYTFGHWNVNGVAAGTSPSITFTATEAANVEAVFNLLGVPPPPDPTKYTLVVSVTPAGAGSTSPTGTTSVNQGARVTFNASPAAGYDFVKWVFNAATESLDNPAAATVDRDGFAAVAKFRAKVAGDPPKEWAVEKTLTLIEDVVLQTSQWESGKGYTSPKFSVGDLSAYLGARLEYTITFQEGNIGTLDVGIDVNGSSQFAGRLNPGGKYGELVTTLSGTAPVAQTLFKDGNTVRVGTRHSVPGYWSKVIFRVKLVLGYSREPAAPPAKEEETPSWIPKLEAWQWALIGVGGLALVLAASGGRGVTIINPGKG